MPRKTPEAHRWHVAFDFLPPSVNHQYGRRGSQAYTERGAASVLEGISLLVAAQGFQFSIKARYSVRVLFTFPSDVFDLDNRVKPLMDSVFGARGDHRVYHLEADKEVYSGRERTELWIEEVG